MNTPPDVIMREMSRLALEAATESLAKEAEHFAPLCAGLSGQEALEAFARSIRATNAKRFPKSGARA